MNMKDSNGRDRNFRAVAAKMRERYIFSSLYNHTCTCQIIFENFQSKTETGSHDQIGTLSYDSVLSIP